MSAFDRYPLRLNLGLANDDFFPFYNGFYSPFFNNYWLSAFNDSSFLYHLRLSSVFHLRVGHDIGISDVDSGWFRFDLSVAGGEVGSLGISNISFAKSDFGRGC